MKHNLVHFICTIIASAFATIEAFSQQEATLYFMSNIPQSSYLNPAFMPQHKLSVGIPGSSILLQYGNSGFSYNDFVSKQNGVVTADLDKLYASLKDKNYVVNGIEADILRMNLRLNPKLFLLVNATAKSFSSLMIPKELAGVLLQGTAPLVGTSSTFALEGVSMSYTEVGVGASYQLNDKLSIGGRLKYLAGIASASVQSATGNIALDNSYAITFSADANIKTSGFKNADNGTLSGYLENSGFSVDLGGTYQLLKKLTLSASILDLGSISWQHDLNAYTLDSKKATYTFKGIDVQKIIDGDDNYLSAEGDSLKNHFTFQEGSTGKYSTMLPSKVYLGGKYNLKEGLSVGALFFSTQYLGRFSPGFSASLQKDFGKIVNTSVSYTISNGTFNNLGLGLAFNLGPAQIYFVGDNLLNLQISLIESQNANTFIKATQNFNMRFGLNFNFGRAKPIEKSSYNKQDGPKTKPKSRGK